MKKRGQILWFVLLLSITTGRAGNGAVSSDTLQLKCANDCALALCLTPKFSKEYYTDQGVKYFRTLQSGIPINVVPNYSELVIRWEWPPWLLLTGYGKGALIYSDISLKLNPTNYDLLDCRYFDTEPFCRCHVVFDYSGTQCPIYEEFTFNDQGEITFIEAWSDYESLLPMGPGKNCVWDEKDYWAMKEVNRLSAKVPGLGNKTGKINPYSDCMNEAARLDKNIAELMTRLKHPTFYWMKQVVTHQKELSVGCDPPEGDVYPYYH